MVTQTIASCDKPIRNTVTKQCDKPIRNMVTKAAVFKVVKDWPNMESTFYAQEVGNDHTDTLKLQNSTMILTHMH